MWAGPVRGGVLTQVGLEGGSEGEGNLVGKEGRTLLARASDCWGYFHWVPCLLEPNGVCLGDETLKLAVLPPVVIWFQDKKRWVCRGVTETAWRIEKETRK